MEALQQLRKITLLSFLLKTLQWMDRTSIRLLTSLIRNPHRDIIFIMTLQSSFRKEIQDFIVAFAAMKNYHIEIASHFKILRSGLFVRNNCLIHTFQTSTIDFIMERIRKVFLCTLVKYLNQLEES